MDFCSIFFLQCLETLSWHAHLPPSCLIVTSLFQASHLRRGRVTNGSVAYQASCLWLTALSVLVLLSSSIIADDVIIVVVVLCDLVVASSLVVAADVGTVDVAIFVAGANDELHERDRAQQAPLRREGGDGRGLRHGNPFNVCRKGGGKTGAREEGRHGSQLMIGQCTQDQAMHIVRTQPLENYN